MSNADYIGPHPRGKGPSPIEIAQYWTGRWPRPGGKEHPDPSRRYRGHIDDGEPFCAACGFLTPILDGLLLRLLDEEERRVRHFDAISRVHGHGWAADEALAKDLADIAKRRAKAEDPWTYSSKLLDRAHLVDHAYGGGNTADNLILLCHLCHKEMPSFDPGEREVALSWVIEHPHRPHGFTLMIQAVAESDPLWWLRLDATQAHNILKRAWVRFLEVCVEQASARRTAA